MFLSKKQLTVLFFATLAFKICLGLYFSGLTFCNFPQSQSHSLAVASGDTFSYLDGINNLLASGEYYFWNGARKVFAGRMPFYGAPYFVLRLFFDDQTAGDVYVLWQIVFDALANVIFACLCFDASRRKAAFWIGFTLYLCSFNYFYASLVLWTESFALSFFVFFLYSCNRFWRTRIFADAVYAAIFLAVLTVLKPYFVILYVAFFLGVSVAEKSLNLAQILSTARRVLILALPLLILLIPWIARNWIVLNRFVPAQENMRAGYEYSPAQIALADFAGAWGSDTVAWDANDAGCYFVENSPVGCRFRLPDYALAPGYTVAEVEKARADYIDLQKNRTAGQERILVAQLNRFTEIYRRERPLMYYVGSRFLFAQRLFRHTGNFNLPINGSFDCYAPSQSVFKIVQALIYLAALSFGVFGLLNLVFRRKTSILLIVFPLTLIVFFALIRASEQRYANPVYQTLLLGLTDGCAFVPTVIKTVLKQMRVKDL